MQKQFGKFETSQASRYLQQLCKHFAHKVEVSSDPLRGEVAFPFGPALLSANETALIVELTGPDQTALARGRSVIDSHLKTFAFREGFETMDWQAITASTASHP